MITPQSLLINLLAPSAFHTINLIHTAPLLVKLRQPKKPRFLESRITDIFLYFNLGYVRAHDNTAPCIHTALLSA